MGFGEALALPSRRPPASRWCHSLMEAPRLPCPSCSAQSLHTQLCARVIQTALPPVCVLRQPESPGTGASPGKGSARLRDTERRCCPGCGALAEPPRPGCCPSSESQTRLCQASFIFFLRLTKDARYLKRPERFCLF